VKKIKSSFFKNRTWSSDSTNSNGNFNNLQYTPPSPITNITTNSPQEKEPFLSSPVASLNTLNDHQNSSYDDADMTVTFLFC
jgi:hypothetical protein